MVYSNKRCKQNYGYAKMKDNGNSSNLDYLLVS